MVSLASEIKMWLEKREESLDFILVSFDLPLVESLIDVLLTCENLSRIVLSNRFLSDHQVNKQPGTSRMEQKGPTKIISTLEYGKDPQRCLIFCDFDRDTRFTPSKLDYFENIDRQIKYRRNCLAVMMYRFTGNPPLNGYWMLNDSKIDNSSSIIFLELSEWGKMCQGAPQTPTFPKDYNPSEILSKPELDRLWMSHVRDYLSYFINFILKTDEFTDQLLSDENICIWIRGFIHETFNYTTNYDALEFLGDRMCKTYFSMYMTAKYPRLLKNELTEYHNQYMSKDHQCYLSDDMNLKELVLANRDVLTFTQGYKTDLFESLVGALYETCQRINFSLANAALLNFFTLVGEQFPFEKKMIYGIDKHRITQILESLGFPPGGDDIKINFNEASQGKMGTKDVISCYDFKYSLKFKNFVAWLITEHKKDLTALFTLKYEFNPTREIRETALDNFWHSMAIIFDRAGIDIRFSKSLRNSFLYTLSFFDPESFQKVKDTLGRMYPKENFDSLAKRIQFKSNKETDNNYVIMYIHTFEVEPDSPLLNSLVMYKDLTQKAGDDCVRECEDLMQIKNLAVVRTPLTGETIGAHQLTSHDLACYNCIRQLIQY